MSFPTLFGRAQEASFLRRGQRKIPFSFLFPNSEGGPVFMLWQRNPRTLLSHGEYFEVPAISPSPLSFKSRGNIDRQFRLRVTPFSHFSSSIFLNFLSQLSENWIFRELGGTERDLSIDSIRLAFSTSSRSCVPGHPSFHSHPHETHGPRGT